MADRLGSANSGRAKPNSKRRRGKGKGRGQAAACVFAYSGLKQLGGVVLNSLAAL
jgi:hypothetical protein